MVQRNLTEAEREGLIQAAERAAQRAHAPYSGFRVGAALLTESGGLYAGCNVENASYGLTMCAERTAIGTAVTAEGGPSLRIRALAVVHEGGRPCPPCGACRQVIAEFGPVAVIYFAGPHGPMQVAAADLLPASFRLPGDALPG